MNPYLSIPVESAREISRQFDKQIVVICAWNHEHRKLHTVTYGVEPHDKISAANAGEICTKALGMDLAKSVPIEDFRTVDAAYNARFRDLAESALHALRSYEHGNSAPDLAKDIADRIEKLLSVLAR